MPAWAARPVPTMMAVGVARPMAHGQAMMRTVMAAMSPSVKLGSGPRTSQATNVDGGEDQDDGHEDRADAVGQRLDGRLGALRLLDHAHDLRQHGVASDARGAQDERAAPVDGRRR